jgi:hypothetical protein
VTPLARVLSMPGENGRPALECVHAEVSTGWLLTAAILVGLLAVVGLAL